METGRRREVRHHFFGPQHIPGFCYAKSLLWPLELTWAGSQKVSSQALSMPPFSSNRTQGTVDKYYKTFCGFLALIKTKLLP